MRRSLPLLPTAYTLFGRVLTLPERIAALARTRRLSEKARTQLTLETMEERLMTDSRPLPNPEIFVGSGVGSTTTVNAYSADTGTLRFSASVSDSFHDGGVRVAAGDLNGDGTPDAIVAAASGRNGQIEVLDGKTGAQISGPLGSFTAFSSVRDGGVAVAAADVQGSGTIDVIAAAETTAGAEVKVFSGKDGSTIADFFVSGAAFQHGITLAAGDFTGAGKADVVVGGINGWVRTYDPLTGNTISGPIGSFQAFGSGYTSGVVSVAADPLAGYVNSGGISELAVGSGRGSTGEVKVFSGSTGAVLDDIHPFGDDFEGGVRVALAYISNPTHPTVPDIVVSSGPGTQTQVKVFSGTSGQQLAAPLGQYEPFGDERHGAFVA